MYSLPVSCVSVRSRCMFEHCLFFAQLERFGGVPLDFHCRHRKNHYPCLSEKQDNKSGNVERERSDERAIRRSCVAAKAHVRYAIFNACHHSHDAKSHALRTRGPCIPIGNFRGLVIARVCEYYAEMYIVDHFLPGQSSRQTW